MTPYASYLFVKQLSASWVLLLVYQSKKVHYRELYLMATAKASDILYRAREEQEQHYRDQENVGVGEEHD